MYRGVGASSFDNVEIAAVAAGTEGLGPQELPALILDGRIVHHAHMGRQKHQVFLLPDLADAAFPVRHIVFGHREIIGEVKDPVHGVFPLLRPLRSANVLVDLLLIETILALIDALHPVAFADRVDHII